jgi:hypothetical protein
MNMNGHLPDGYDRQQAQTAQTGKWKSEKEKEKEGPVKNACLSCRSKKAKCDGILPICGQVSQHNSELILVRKEIAGVCLC